MNDENNKYQNPVYQQNQVYQQPPYQQYGQAPMTFLRMKTNRNLGNFILLNILTLGIYSIVFFTCAGEDLNKMAYRYDGKKTINFCLVSFLLGPLTLGIFYLIWFHQFSDRVGEELKRRRIAIDFDSNTFWLWDFLGSFILVGPFIYTHKLCDSMNYISENYNSCGC